MRISSKQNIAVGSLLLVLSAFFSIALILQLLDFGSFGPGHGNMFNEIKKYWLVKEMKNEKNFIGKIVYSFDDGELITEYTEITVW